MRLAGTEWLAMSALWRKGSATARELHAALEPTTGWAYTTVATILKRLAEKGAVESKRRGSARVFEPKVTRLGARRSAFRTLLERAFDGAVGPFLHFLLEEERLSKREREELKRLLEEGG